MRKEIVKLIAGAAGIGVVVLVAITAAQMGDRENVLERITQWPDLAVQTLEGNEIATSQLLSGAPVLFNYFNTECIFCKAEIEDIAEHTALQDAVTLVFMSDEDPEILERFRHNYGFDENPNVLFLVDTGGVVKEYYRIRSVPATYIYNSDGKLIEFFRGSVKAEALYSHVMAIGKEAEWDMR